MLHRTRHLFIRQQTSVINAIRAHLAEFGIVAPVGRRGVEELLTVVADPNDKRVPEIARACLSAFGAQLRSIKEQVLEFDRLITAWHRSNEMSMRLDEAPGVGPVLATALVATVADPKVFRSGRNFSAWIGLVPKQHSSGGKDRLGSISKQGDRYLRGLFVAGALAVIRYAKIHGTKHRLWLTALLARRPTKIAAIALANKIARMVWAMMANTGSLNTETLRQLHGCAHNLIQHGERRRFVMSAPIPLRRDFGASSCVVWRRRRKTASGPSASGARRNL